MTARTMTGDFDSVDKMKNALDDLVATGIDREKVFMDKSQMQLKVMVPEEIEREITEILQRHNPTFLH